MVLIKPSVITIGGEPGTGTTTIVNLLSARTGLKIVNTGEIFRQLAKEHNMDLTSFSSYAKSKPEIDFELDKRQVEIAKGGSVILEGRLSGWLMKNNNIPGFTVLLTADLATRIKRIMGREKKSYEQVKSEVLAREKCEQDRYQKFYNVNYLDSIHYDLIIDTSNLTPEEIVNRIIGAISDYETK